MASQSNAPGTQPAPDLWAPVAANVAQQIAAAGAMLKVVRAEISNVAYFTYVYH